VSVSRTMTTITAAISAASIAIAAGTTVAATICAEGQMTLSAAITRAPVGTAIHMEKFCD